MLAMLPNTFCPHKEILTRSDRVAALPVTSTHRPQSLEDYCNSLPLQKLPPQDIGLDSFPAKTRTQKPSNRIPLLCYQMPLPPSKHGKQTLPGTVQSKLH